MLLQHERRRPRGPPPESPGPGRGRSGRVGAGAAGRAGCRSLATHAAAKLRLGWQADRRRWALGLGIILGGAVGNLADRALRAGDGVLGGRVVDFIDLQWWPVFNVADSALWIGIGVLLFAAREAEGES